MMGGIRIIGIGNAYRSDDAVGLVVARLLKSHDIPDASALEYNGEATTLMDAWQGADQVFLIDAVSSGATPGTIFKFEASENPLPTPFSSHSTHALSLAEAVEMARHLERLPSRLTIYGIEGKSFSYGQRLSAEVKKAAQMIVDQILIELLP